MGTLDTAHRMAWLVIALLALAGAASAVPVLEDRSVAFNGALHLRAFQNADGSWPGQLAPARDACGCESVAGVAGLGMLRAFGVSTNRAFLDSAERTEAYLLSIHAAPAARLSAPSVFFLVELSVVSNDERAREAAIAAFERVVADHGSAAALANAILDARAAEGAPNLGFFEAGLWAQAAATSGHRSNASEIAMAMNLRATEVVRAAPHAALALAGLVEANARSNVDNFQRAQAHAATLATLADDDGGFGAVEPTAHAAMAFYAVGDVPRGRAASSWVHGAWDPSTRGWPEAGVERSDVTSAAIQALAMAVAPAPSAATSYALSTYAAGPGSVPDPQSLVPPGFPPQAQECDGYPFTAVTPTGTGPWPADCAPGANLVYAWVCVGYGGTVDHFGTSLGFPRPGLATPHPIVISQFARDAAVDATEGTFDPAGVYVAWAAQNESSGQECSQTTP